jgi:protein subunit release factor A
VTPGVVSLALDLLKIVAGALVAVIAYAVKETKERSQYVTRPILDKIVEEHREDIDRLSKEHRMQMERLIEQSHHANEAMWRNAKAEFATKEQLDGGLKLAALELRQHSNSLNRLDEDIRHLMRCLNMTPPPDGPRTGRRRADNMTPFNEDTPT